ncbi:hypothetical protein BC940DRAFT_236851 [Gongronella butleri]|nr:hypothetical protein BC940DRAFT_236851 [Gongronella butleri]
MNRQPPHIDNVCFDGQTCVVYLTQIIQPRLFPWITLKVPMIVNLGFRETDLDSGLWKVYMHEESWTIDGFLDSMPLISYWYQSVLRVFNGKLIVLSGKFIHTVTETAQLLKDRNQEIETATRRLSQGNVDAKQLSQYDTVMNGKHP